MTTVVTRYQNLATAVWEAVEVFGTIGSIFSIGTAWGVDKAALQPGDVVVPKQIVGYYRKVAITANGQYNLSPIPESSYQLLKVIHNAELKWPNNTKIKARESLGLKKQERPFQVVLGRVLSAGVKFESRVALENVLKSSSEYHCVVGGEEDLCYP